MWASFCFSLSVCVSSASWWIMTNNWIDCHIHSLQSHTDLDALVHRPTSPYALWHTPSHTHTQWRIKKVYVYFKTNNFASAFSNVPVSDHSLIIFFFLCRWCKKALLQSLDCTLVDSKYLFMCNAEDLFWILPFSLTCAMTSFLLKYLLDIMLTENNPKHTRLLDLTIL